MQKAFEYEVEFNQPGRVLKRRLSIGPVLITTAATLLLTFTGHTLIGGLTKLWLAVKWW